MHVIKRVFDVKNTLLRIFFTSMLFLLLYMVVGERNKFRFILPRVYDICSHLKGFLRYDPNIANRVLRTMFFRTEDPEEENDAEV